VETIINGVKGTWSEVANIALQIFRATIQSVETLLISPSTYLCEVLNCCDFYSKKCEQK